MTKKRKYMKRKYILKKENGQIVKKQKYSKKYNPIRTRLLDSEIDTIKNAGISISSSKKSIKEILARDLHAGAYLMADPLYLEKKAESAISFLKKSFHSREKGLVI